MRKLIAVLLLCPAAILLYLSMAIDSEPGSEWLEKLGETIADKAGFMLVPK